MRCPLTYLLFALAVGATGQVVPDTMRAPRWTVRTQFAGMQGTLSTGLFRNMPEGRLHVGAQYGFAPSRNGGKAYHGAILRATGSWFPIHRPQFGKWNLSPIMSLAAAWELGGIAFLSLPKNYPDDYYAPQSLHGLLSFGGRVGRVGDDGSWSFTAEAVTMDTYLWYGLIQQQIKIHNMWNLALGLEYHF